MAYNNIKSQKFILISILNQKFLFYFPELISFTEKLYLKSIFNTTSCKKTYNCTNKTNYAASITFTVLNKLISSISLIQLIFVPFSNKWLFMSGQGCIITKT